MTSLCLGRRVGQTIILENTTTGESITVTVAKIQPSYVRIAISAESVWNIRRAELPPRPIQASNDDLTELGCK